MTKQDQKLERLIHANAVIKAMSLHGRRFFYYTKLDRTAELSLDRSNRVCHTDEYTGRTFIVKAGTRWQNFSNGGTLQAIIEKLAEYVRTGKQVHPGYFGPWADYICDGDLWGYGHEAMIAVRAELSDNPAIAPRPPVVEAPAATKTETETHTETV